jgi:myo-inositol 2-dehydrogenase/D-chiro-inositol 1-dehydrogenase
MSDGKRKLSLAMIGAGRIGRVHAETIAFRLPEARLVAIADPNRDVAQRLAGEFEIARVVDGPNEIFDDPSIDAVLICSPTSTHSSLVQEAAAAGKHVFCEKPIDNHLARIDQALSAVERAGIKFQVGFNRRFDANPLRIRQAVASGEIGRPQRLHIISRDPAPPPLAFIATSGGMFLDMTTHDFDMARFLLDDEVEEIYTAGGVLIDPEIGKAGDLDTAVITLHFRGGAIGTIENSRQAVYGYDQRIEVFGSQGAIASGNRFANEAVVSSSTGIRREPPLNFFMDRYIASFAAELTAFVDAVINGKATPVNGNDGRIAAAMAVAARKSYDERRPVKVSEVS